MIQSRARTRRGLTLLELLVVVFVMAAVAVAAVRTQNKSNSQMTQQFSNYDLSTVAAAIRQFKADMGEPPQFIAELLQSPANTDGFGGWWWRNGLGTTGTPYVSAYPPIHLQSYDPTTKRGWRGPYLQIEAQSAVGAEWSEGRFVYIGTTTPVLDVRASATTTNPITTRSMTGIVSALPGYSIVMDGSDPLRKSLWLRMCDPSGVPTPDVPPLLVGIPPFDVAVGTTP